MLRLTNMCREWNGAHIAFVELGACPDEAPLLLPAQPLRGCLERCAALCCSQGARQGLCICRDKSASAGCNQRLNLNLGWQMYA